MLRKSFVSLAITSVGVMFVISGCASQSYMEKKFGMLEGRVAQVSQHVEDTNARLNDLTAGVNTNFSTVREDMERMQGQITTVGDIASDARSNAGVAIEKISSVYKETRKAVASVAAARKEARQARKEAVEAHGKLAKSLGDESTKTRKVVGDEAKAVREYTTDVGDAMQAVVISESGNVQSAIKTDGDSTRANVTEDGGKTREEGKNAWTDASDQAKRILEELEKLKANPPPATAPTTP